MEMQIEQNFTDSDLEDLYQFMMEGRKHDTVRWRDKEEREQNGVWTRCKSWSGFLFIEWILIFIQRKDLFPYRNIEYVMYIVLAGIILFRLFVRRKLLGRKVKLRDVLKHSFEELNAVTLKEDAVIYGKWIVWYTDIQRIIECHDLLFLICKLEHEGLMLTIKAEGEEKAAVLSMLQEKSGICAEKQEGNC